MIVALRELSGKPVGYSLTETDKKLLETSTNELASVLILLKHDGFLDS